MPARQSQYLIRGLPAADGAAVLAPLLATAWETPAAEGYFSRFVSSSGSSHAPERFDEEAARIYHLAEDPLVQGDQAQIIRKILERRRNTVSLPLVTSYEEQDPHFGRWTTSLLTSGEYGDHRFANNNYLRLNRPPTTIPPGMLNLHFCWGLGYEGSRTGSDLHALTALVLDDWRNALSSLPVRFQMHRLGPDPASLSAGRGGPRWRDRTFGLLPPEGAVGILFQRANRARALAPLRVVRETVGPQQWWCACLTECDLSGLSFTRVKSPALGSVERVLWSAEQSSLPAGIEHILVIPDKVQPGSFCHVTRSGRATNLTSVTTLREHVPETNWQRFRVSALDVALNVLLERMR